MNRLRQFDAASNPEGARRPAVPYLIVLQSHLLFDMPTLVVAPIRLTAHAEDISDIRVPVMFEGQAMAIMVAELAYIPTKRLGKAVGSLADHEDAIRRSLDRIFTGF